MRSSFLIILAAVVAVSTPALAGTVSVVNGAPSWASTQCKEPAEASSLMRAHRETPADKMNILVTQYNAYAAQMQEYMNCLSNEASTDSNNTSQAITASAQAQIDTAQKKVNEMGANIGQKK